LTLPGLKLQPLCRPAHSQLLHQLRYPSSLMHSVNMCIIAIKCFLRPILNILKIFIRKPSYSETQSIPKFLYLILSEFLCRVYSLYKCFLLSLTEQKLFFVMWRSLLQRDLSIKKFHS
jgi:hypothetical protein